YANALLDFAERRCPACEAGESVKPGVERSGTPGTSEKRIRSPRKRAAERLRSAQIQSFEYPSSVARVRGLGICSAMIPGSCAPGFTLSPAPQAPRTFLDA